MKKTFFLALLLVGCFGSGNRAWSGTVTFDYTGQAQNWIVPVDVTSVSFVVTGATGADRWSEGGIHLYGGQGAKVSGTLKVSGGTSLALLVGQGGQGTVGGFNGGGSGGIYWYCGGGGGGASDIRIGGSTLADRVIVAGGGGGGVPVWRYFGGSVGIGAETSTETNGQFGTGSSGTYGGGGGGYYGGRTADPNNYSNGGGSSYFNPDLTNGVTSTNGGSGDVYGPNGQIVLTYTPVPLLTWRNTHFSSVANTGDSADSFDYDGDGIQNLAEYALGGNPKVPDAATIMPKLGMSGNHLQISFNCDTAKTDISYIAQASPDLSTGSWIEIAKSLGGAATQPINSLSTVSDTGTGSRTVTVTDSTSIPANGKRFLRLQIVNPTPTPTPTPPPP